MRCCRKKFTFAISSPDELLYFSPVGYGSIPIHALFGRGNVHIDIKQFFTIQISLFFACLSLRFVYFCLVVDITSAIDRLKGTSTKGPSIFSDSRLTSSHSNSHSPCCAIDMPQSGHRPIRRSSDDRVHYRPTLLESCNNTRHIRLQLITLSQYYAKRPAGKSIS